MLNFPTLPVLAKLALPTALVFLCACAPRSNSEWALSAGDAVPAFSLESSAGETVSSESLLGKPYVISVFATWCPPCKTELLAFEEKLWQPLKDQGISVVAINYGDEDTSTVAEFVRTNNLTFPVLVDEAGEFRQKTGVAAVPHSLVVGPDGKIIDLHLGYTDESVTAIGETLKEAKE